VKYNGYRIMVIRDGDRVRLLSRGGCDYTRRFPWVVEAARKREQRQFIIDGEAVLLAFHGISDFDGLHSGKQDEAVQFYAGAIRHHHYSVGDRDWQTVDAKIGIAPVRVTLLSERTVRIEPDDVCTIISATTQRRSNDHPRQRLPESGPRHRRPASIGCLEIGGCRRKRRDVAGRKVERFV
jgi:hypothetical protein